MIDKLKLFILSLYNSHQVFLKGVVSAFAKAFLAVFIPSIFGILANLSGVAGGSIHLSFLLSVVLSAVIAAFYAGVHAVVAYVSPTLQKTVTPAALPKK